MLLQTLKPPISCTFTHRPCSSSSGHRLLLRPPPECCTGLQGWAPPVTTDDLSIRRCFRATASAATTVGSLWSDHAGGDGGNCRVIPKTVDLATLGNLCVDIVLNVPLLPPEKREDRKAYTETLEASPPDKKFWEAGGNCNLTIAAARLGLHCVALGHVGEEVYGRFLVDVLQDEDVGLIGMNDKVEAASHYDIKAYETLLCWVLVDPFQRHGFCSVADFSAEPAFNWMRSLSGKAKMVIQQSKILFCNGYAFDELYPDVITDALKSAVGAGTSVFFDPGPRVKTLLHGTPEEQEALQLFLSLSDVLLFTTEEAETLTGIKNPIQAGQEFIKKGERSKWIILKLGSKGSVLISRSGVSYAPAFKVNVVDTVGCGDSFTAAIAFGFLHDMPTIETLTLANAVGAATATGVGAGRNVARLHDVLDILRLSNLNEDDELRNRLIHKRSEQTQVSILSKAAVNGCGDGVVRAPVQNVVHEILLKFDALANKRVIQL